MNPSAPTYTIVPSSCRTRKPDPTRKAPGPAVLRQDSASAVADRAASLARKLELENSALRAEVAALQAEGIRLRAHLGKHRLRIVPPIPDTEDAA